MHIFIPSCRGVVSWRERLATEINSRTSTLGALDKTRQVGVDVRRAMELQVPLQPPEVRIQSQREPSLGSWLAHYADTVERIEVATRESPANASEPLPNRTS